MNIYEDLGPGARGGIKKLFVLGFVFANLLLLTSALYYGVLAREGAFEDDPANVFHMAVSGEGTVSARPDIALFTFSIRTEDPSLRAAQDENSKKSRAVVDFLKANGIDEKKDMKTSGYNFYPQYDYPRDVVCGGQGCIPRKPVLRGYQVTESFEV